MSILTLSCRLLDVVLPPACGACDLPGEPVCDVCLTALRPPPGPACGGCGHPVPLPVDRCPACVPSISGASQACLYRGPAPALITRLKDEGRRDLAGPLADLTAANVAPPGPGARLVPVPVPAARSARRGFNQAEVLARALASRWRLPVAEVIERRHDGPPQRGASRSVRRRQVAGAFGAVLGVATPRHAVLVDDVHTTGATLAACAAALRRAGSQRVSAVCVARVLDARLPIPGVGAYDGRTCRIPPRRPR